MIASATETGEGYTVEDFELVLEMAGKEIEYFGADSQEAQEAATEVALVGQEIAGQEVCLRGVSRLQAFTDCSLPKASDIEMKPDKYFIQNFTEHNGEVVTWLAKTLKDGDLLYGVYVRELEIAGH